VETPSFPAEKPASPETERPVDLRQEPENDGRGGGDFTLERNVYEPHPIGLPPLRPYLRAVWQRRHFALELARTNLRVQHFNTALGQLWLVVNPLLLGFIYFLLVDIVRAGSRGPEFLAHLMLGLFAFRFVSDSVSQGARSVVGGGRLILNTAFPRTLLPLASVMTSFMRFVPTLLVYGVMHVIAGLPVGLHLLWAIPIFALLAVFATGAAMLVATAQVYFRDLRNFLPYLTRIWLYVSPILYYAHEVPSRFKPIVEANPLYPLLTSLSDVVNGGGSPSAGLLLWGLASAVVAFVAGGLLFISREREFAVRL
jgi:ABC-type polysaccharide/polyol phosphate export permease